MKNLEDLIKLGTVSLARQRGKVELIFEPDLDRVPAKKYYTVQIMRPDLAAAVAVLAEYMEDPTKDASDYPATFFDPDVILDDDDDFADDDYDEDDEED